MKWPNIKLQEVCHLITDGVHNSPEYCSTGIPMLDSKHIGENFFIDDTKPEKFISPATDAMLSTRCKPNTDDVLISSRGSIGKIAIVGCKQNFNIMGNIILIRAAKNITPRFLAYTLKNKVNHLVSIANGAAQKGLYLNQIRSLLISLPPLAEQQRIAAILDKAEEIKRKREQAIAKLDELAQSTFIEMFGSLFEKNTISLKEICNRITDGTHQSPQWESAGIPFLFISNIVNNEIEFKTNKYISFETYTQLTRNCPIEIGDVLYTTVGSYGNVAIVKDDTQFCFQRHIAQIKPNYKFVTSTFLAAMLRTDYVRYQVDKVARGVAQKTVNLGDLGKLNVICPPLQDQITFNKTIEGIEKLRISILNCKGQTKHLFDSLQHQAFTTGFNA